MSMEPGQGAFLERLVKFEVLGQEYPLYTDAPQDDVDEILQLVRSQLEENTNGSILPANKLAILASLNMAGKYVRLKKDFEQYRQMVEKTVGKVADRIDSAEIVLR